VFGGVESKQATATADTERVWEAARV
jgi:hypothetical protein